MIKVKQAKKFRCHGKLLQRETLKFYIGFFYLPPTLDYKTHLDLLLPRANEAKRLRRA